MYWLFFNVSFDPLIFFFVLFTVLSFQSQGSSGFLRNAALVRRLPPRCSVFVCFCPSLPVVDVSLSVSSVLHFHQSVPFFASAWLRLTPPPCPFFISHVKISDLSCCQICICIYFPNTSGTVWAFTVQRLCWHNSFICNKTMQQLGLALPLVDVCLSFLSREEEWHHSSS